MNVSYLQCLLQAIKNWRWVEPRNKSRNGLRALVLEVRSEGGGDDWKEGMGMISQAKPLLFSCCMLIMEMIVRQKGSVQEGWHVSLMLISSINWYLI